MAEASIMGTGPGGALLSILDCDDLQPGWDPSYQDCKTIYLYHPLGGKMVDSPIKKAMFKPRVLTTKGHPEEVTEQFVKQWKQDQVDDHIRQTAAIARTYGVGSTVMGDESGDTTKPIAPDKLATADIFFNSVDPLNTAGSIVLNQDPNSKNFQKPPIIDVAGKPYHPSRSVVIMNERPVYIAYTSSAFGYVGRSVFQRPLYPLKTFIQTMITNDMVTQKAGVLVAKVQPAGGIVDRIMGAATALKRQMLKGSRTGNVLSISAGTTSQNAEDITTLNMMNVDGAGGWARTNVLKDIATAADMPAVFLENETLTEGFGEGSEDAQQIADYLTGVREWLQPLYDFHDPINMRRAWNPEFINLMRDLYPDLYKGKDDNTIFFSWKNAFNASWKTMREEPESEKAKSQKVKAEAVTDMVEVMIPRCDPENAAKLLQWAAENINESKELFPIPLELDWEAMATYEPPTPDLEEEPDAPKSRADSMNIRGVVSSVAGRERRRITG